MTADVLAAVILASIVLYVLLGGADFGGGLWDLLASGPRATAQRRLIERAIAPIWEANHVWLIIAVVLLFTGFPAVFAAASIALHIPLSLLLLGIVLRGSAFTFRHYGDRASAPGWGRVFAVTSIITPLFLGISLGALSSGEIRVIDGRVTSDIYSPWIGLFPTGVGLFTLALFALLAAVYLTCETEDPALQDDFRRRALWSGIGAGGAALIAALSAAQEAAHFKNALLHSWWSWPLQIVTGAAASGTLLALWKRHYRLARALVIVQTTGIVLGWGAAQYPYLITPDLTIQSAAAPAHTQQLVLAVLAFGTIVLLPSLLLLLRTFKSK